MNLLRLAALLCLFALPASAERLSLAEISRHLNGLTSVTAPFQQINDDGTRSSGTLYIKRPGRMRFEYDPPQEAVVVAGGGAVVIFDPKSDQIAETYPLKQTPLSLILDREVDLTRADMVVGHASDNGFTVVRAQDPENPEYGYVDLMFSETDGVLSRWRLSDASGAQTMVLLGPMERTTLSDTLFSTTTVGERGGR